MPARAGHAARETLRLCWELVAARRLRGADPLAALAERGVREAVARLVLPGRPVRVAAVVELGKVDDVSAAVALAARVVDVALALDDVGVGLDLWPQLSDDLRFLNTRTARRFHERLLPVLHAVVAHPRLEGLSRPLGLFLDVEPPLATLEGAWSLGNGAPIGAKARGLGRLLGGVVGAVWDARQGRRDLVELARDTAALPLSVVAAVPPPILPLDALAGDVAQHWIFGCPLDDGDGRPLFRRTAALCYAPLLSRLPSGRDREAQHRTFSLWAARHRERSDALCLGPLSTGLLGDEPTYESPEHVRHDLAAARALGFSDITLYSLEGLLFGSSGDPLGGLRDDLDAWLAALAPADAAALAAGAA